MFCANCGSEIGEGTRFCPYCGARVTGNAAYAAPAEPTAAPEKKTNGYAIAGLVLSLVSLYFGAVIVTSILGIVFSVRGRRDAAACRSGMGLATAGLVVSIVTLVLWIITWIVIIAVVAAA